MSRFAWFLRKLWHYLTLPLEMSRLEQRIWDEDEKYRATLSELTLNYLAGNYTEEQKRIVRNGLTKHAIILKRRNEAIQEAERLRSPKTVIVKRKIIE